MKLITLLSVLFLFNVKCLYFEENNNGTDAVSSKRSIHPQCEGRPYMCNNKIVNVNKHLQRIDNNINIIVYVNMQHEQ